MRLNWAMPAIPFDFQCSRFCWRFDSVGDEVNFANRRDGTLKKFAVRLLYGQRSEHSQPGYNGCAAAAEDARSLNGLYRFEGPCLRRLLGDAPITVLAVKQG